MQQWMYLIVAIIFEVAGTTAMKMSEGFTKTVPSVVMFVFYILSLVALTYALKKIDMSMAYAVWAGVGTALITLVGIFLFKEPATMLKLASIALIIIGIVGLHLGGEAA
jgi:small multidrug resistance pump